jgi:hypothetical protein
MIVFTLFSVSFFLLNLFILWRSGIATPHSEHLDYKDFVAILLTGVTVMIAIAALFVAAAAIWTYKEGMEVIRAAADKAAREVAEGIATRVAREVSEGVATRVARETRPSDTDAEQAAEIVGAMAAEEAPDGK